ncbi:hypothetical protein T440DRAFT_86645 [Plenodomus tracheiphilus IPT5]|uniref:DUF7730 domain-containing protein n=1 Tax=Plenodomus tracheiphilus IPT5 TaxID=1408161 RepID=A0A6A7B5S1_9PLEO|nr:hypothetical protein T440DRAFT_86645 [Plenodomus tracheiphilus IPT5]
MQTAFRKARGRKSLPQSRFAAPEDVLLTEKSEHTLLGLPREIRDMIYEYAIGNEDVHLMLCIGSHKDSVLPYTFGFTSPNMPVRKSAMSWTDLFGLSRSCRQLYQETQLLPYKLSIFNLWSRERTEVFLSHLSDKQRDSISTIMLSRRLGEGTWKITKQLERLVGLKRILMDGLSPDEQKVVQAFATKKDLCLVTSGGELSG